MTDEQVKIDELLQHIGFRTDEQKALFEGTLVRLARETGRSVSDLLSEEMSRLREERPSQPALDARRTKAPAKKVPTRKEPRGDKQYDLFVPYLTDLPLRDQKDTMERPFFALSNKRKRLKPIDYRSPDGKVWVQVKALPEYGMATIYDADILIWCASQINEHMERHGRNDPPPATIHFMPHNLLKAIRRATGGGEYEALKAALRRLKSTDVTTNLRASGKKKERHFNWLDNWSDEVDEATGKSRGMSVTLSKWLYDAIIEQGGILSIHEDYFLLKGGLERWLYRVARKHGGYQPQGMQITVATLFEKSGSEDLPRRFKAAIKEIVQADALPQYHLEWIEETEGGDSAVHFTRRSVLAPTHPAFQPAQIRNRSRAAFDAS